MGAEDQANSANDSTLNPVDAIDLNYKPFKSFDAWQGVGVSWVRWKERHDRIMALADDGDAVLSRTRQLMNQVAALETGALEGLYELDRGVTITLVSSAVAWQAILDQQPAKGLIQAQLRAYDYVLDFATKSRDIAEAWIRELHSVICAEQSTYAVVIADGKKEQRALTLGEYKKAPNHVLRADGTYHSYCPIAQTASEMQRFVGELQSDGFQKADPVLQAAYAHHAFVTIHPFQDGNGRVARALASVFSYRAVRIPLIFLAEMRTEYLDALELADDHRLDRFCELVERVGEITLELVEEGVRTAAMQSPLEAIREARGLYRTRGGYRHEEVDQAGRALFEMAVNAVKALLQSFPGGEITGTCRMVAQHRVAGPTGFRSVVSTENLLADCAILTSSPAEARHNFNFVFFVPVDAGPDDVILLQEQGPEVAPFRARLRDLLPTTSVALQGRLALWVQRLVTQAILEAQGLADKKLREQGYY